MIYANESIRRRPSYANDNHAVPMVLSTGRACADILKPWGSVVYVHDEKAKGFTVKGRKGYMIGLSRLHADGIYDIYMCDTKRIVQTMNVIFHQTPGLPEASMPDELFFDLTTRAPVEPLDGCPGCVANDVVADQQVGLPDVGHNIPSPTFDDTISVRVNHCKYPLNARLAVGNLSRITPIHGRARVQALAGLTVNDALTMSYFVGREIQTLQMQRPELRCQ